MKPAPLLTTRQVVLRIAVIVGLVELAIMLVAPAIPIRAGNFYLAVFDVALLAVLTTPALYLWVIKPFVQGRDAMLSQMSELASTDPLTQLANRRVLSKHLEEVLAGSEKHHIPAAVLLIDVDGFKQINDLHGHDTGDAVLVETAKRIKSITRAEDMASRVGGDEFVLVVNRLDPDQTRASENAVQTAQKLIELVKHPMVFDEQTLQVGISIGIRLLGFEALDSRTALGEADAAMYTAKQTRRGSAILFER